MVEIIAAEGNARKSIGLVFGCGTRPKAFRYCDYHRHEKDAAFAKRAGALGILASQYFQTTK